MEKEKAEKNNRVGVSTLRIGITIVVIAVGVGIAWATLRAELVSQKDLARSAHVGLQSQVDDRVESAEYNESQKNIERRLVKIETGVEHCRVGMTAIKVQQGVMDSKLDLLLKE